MTRVLLIIDGGNLSTVMSDGPIEVFIHDRDNMRATPRDEDKYDIYEDTVHNPTNDFETALAGIREEIKEHNKK